MAATFYWSARGLALEWPWHAASPWAATGSPWWRVAGTASADLAGTVADTGAKISTIAADASDPDRLAARMRELYLGNGAPGVIVYNAVMGAPDRLLSSRVAHLRVAPQQHQTHLGLVNLDLEPRHLTQERGGGCKIVNLQIGPGSSRTRSPPHATGTQVAHQRAPPFGTHFRPARNLTRLTQNRYSASARSGRSSRRRSWLASSHGG